MSKRKVKWTELPMKFDRSGCRKLLQPKVRKTIDLEVRKIANDLTNHFKKDKWDISAESYTSEVLYKVFGFHIEEYIQWLLWKKLAKKNPNIKLVLGQQAPPTMYTLNAKKHFELYIKVWEYYNRISGKKDMLKNAAQKAKERSAANRLRRRNRTA